MTDGHDQDPLDLAPLAPSERFVVGLPALGREAARRADARVGFGARLGATGRWFVPAAAAAVVLCWVAASRRPPEAPAPRGSAILGAATDADTARALLLASEGVGR